MGVDHSNAAPQGRESVRLTSTRVYDSGPLLFLLDLSHMPGGVCGSWPALLVSFFFFFFWPCFFPCLSA